MKLSRSLTRRERKEKILDGVELMILEKRSTDFTMVQLANQIGISPTTFYNIFGSKGAILYSLLNRGLDSIISGRGSPDEGQDPVAFAVHCMTYAAQVFVNRSDLYRTLYKFQLAERDMQDRGRYLQRGLEYWNSGLQGLVDRGYLRVEPTDGAFTRDDVALALLTHSAGVIDLWVQEDLSDAQFLARMTHSAALIVSAVVPEEARGSIHAIIRETAPQLGGFSFVRKR